ncbi:zinc finger A20 and AN1 domain-containing stress-associated protein 2 [Populus trichocarpa]|uniref:zinc finger A20 and AN1 domain-containing stress-associated protein 2 n=1 Tax=Populus trichocarpa TaxID=3694 RepID=UPI0022793F09|nr:zinc finger A20 and AN1 domain-containing stress-associated protein 2 [Populus trichocarpa]
MRVSVKGDSDAGKWSRTRPEPQGPSKAPKLCANSCGFFGTATTMNLCSKCHDDFILKQEHAKMALSICCVCYERFLSVDTTSNAVIAVAVDPPATSAVPLISSIPALSAAASSTDHTKSFLRAIHHYPDKHNCSSDYRSAGQDAIAKANPIVKAEKLDKI